MLEVEAPATSQSQRRYRLPAARAEVLLDRDTLKYVAPLALGGAAIAATLPDILEAFRSGGGVAYERYGADTRDCIALGNRPKFLNLLGSEWLPAIPEVDARLRAEPPARVADIGCGTGWSSLAIARAYPKVSVDGLDLDAASIADARDNAAASGLGERVSFQVRNAGDPALGGGYALVTVFETLHDMADPVGALRAMRALAAPVGRVLIADERVAEDFNAPGDDVERLMYGWSALQCLPRGNVRFAVAWDGHGDEPGDPPAVRDRGRLQRCRDTPDRARRVAFLSALALSDRSSAERPRSVCRRLTPV